MTRSVFEELIYLFVDKKVVDMTESDALRIKVNYPLYLVHFSHEKRSKDNMFEKAIKEDFEANKQGPQAILTLSQKHRITKKKGEKGNQVLGDKNKLQSSSTNVLNTAQYSNRQERQLIVITHPQNDEVAAPYPSRLGRGITKAKWRPRSVKGA